MPRKMTQVAINSTGWWTRERDLVANAYARSATVESCRSQQYAEAKPMSAGASSVVVPSPRSMDPDFDAEFARSIAHLTEE